MLKLLRPNHVRDKLLAVLAGTAVLLTGASVADAAPPAHWVGTWASVPTTTPATATPTLADETVRQVVHTSAAGDEVRLRLTNEFGTTPLRLGAVHVARRAGATGTAIDPRTDRVVTFGGVRAPTVPAGSPLVSDPVRLAVPARSDLVVSIHVPGPTPVTSLHNFAFQENVVAPGDVTDDREVTGRTITAWYFLSAVSVRTTDRDATAVVAFGDSITDGYDSAVGANHRWPDLLAERLRGKGVLNLGVSGNRLLHDPAPPPGSDAEGYAAFFGESALRRFDRDVLTQPGVEHVVVLLGVNDLGQPGTIAPITETVTARDIVNAHRQLIARAHAAGIEVVGGTILPFDGDLLGFHSPENEAKRQAVNHWIRESGEYDGVADFDAALRDPAAPERLNPAYDSGDHLHPNDKGMYAMAAAVPLHLLR